MRGYCLLCLKFLAAVVKVMQRGSARFQCVCKFSEWRVCTTTTGSLLIVHLSVFDLTSECVYVFRISCKDLKSMLSQVNYRVPNMRFLREKLPVTFSPQHRRPPFLTLSAYFLFTAVLAYDLFLITIPPPNCPSQDSELRNGDVSFSQFAQLYRSLMFDAQKNVSAVILYVGIGQSQCFHPPSPHLMHSRASLPFPSQLSVLKWLHDQYEKSNLNPVVVAIKAFKHSPRQRGRLVWRLSGVKLNDLIARLLSPQQDVCFSV